MKLTKYQRRYYAYNCLRNWARNDAWATGENRARGEISFKVYDKITALELHDTWRFENVDTIMREWEVVKRER